MAEAATVRLKHVEEEPKPPAAHLIHDALISNDHSDHALVDVRVGQREVQREHKVQLKLTELDLSHWPSPHTGHSSCSNRGFGTIQRLTISIGGAQAYLKNIA